MQPEWEIWHDIQLSSSLAKIMQNKFGISAKSAFILGHRDLEDYEIFRRAKGRGFILITKDADFPALVTQYGCIPNCRNGFAGVVGEDTAHGCLPWLVSPPASDNLECIPQYGSPLKIIKLNTGNQPASILWGKYKNNFKSGIELLQSTDAEVIFIE